MNPLVSVLVPSYNHSEYIVEALRSLSEQTYKEFELIIIDDGSKDNSVEIIKETIPRFFGNTKKIQFHQQENSGICKTLNKGLKLSKGKYFHIMPSDDLMNKQFLEKQVQFLENNPFACSYTNGLHINSVFIEKKEYNKGVLFSENISFKSGNINSFLLSNVFNLPSPSFLYRTSILNEIGGFDEDIKFEDVDLMLRISKRYDVGYIDEQLFLHRIHDNNSGRNKEIIIDALNVLNEKFIINNYLSLKEEEISILASYFEKVRQKFLNPHVKRYWFDIDVEKLKDIKKNKTIVAWGTGDFAESFIYKYPDLVFDYFIDSKRVGKWNGYEVKSSNKLIGATNTYVVILSSFNQEITIELEKMGFKKNLDFC